MQKKSHSLIRERHRHYEADKEAIVADLLAMGRPATRKKWNINSSSLHSLVKRWLTEEQRAAIPVDRNHTKEVPPPPSNPSPPDGTLPPFPQFSDTWHPEVQLERLNVYSTLATRQGSR